MATCRHIVNSALRKLGRLGGGREPRVADQTDALAALQGLYGSWVASGAFGRLHDVIPLSDCVAGENQRIVRDARVITVTLPEYVPMFAQPLPYDQERMNYEAVDGSNRPPCDGAVVQLKDTNGGQVETWIYDGSQREWTLIDSLQLDNQAPRSAGDPEGLAAVLAIEIADTFGAEVGQSTLRQSQRFISNLVTNPSTPRRVVPRVYC